MPPKARRTVGHNGDKTRRATRQSSRTNNAIPSVYADMLAEAAVEESKATTSASRPIKRRKLSEGDEQSLKQREDRPAPLVVRPGSSDDESSQLKPQPVVYDDFEGSEDSDVEFEDIDLDLAEQNPTTENELQEQKSIQIDLSKPSITTPRKPAHNRKPITKAERNFRLDVHKWHFMFLLLHGLERSRWCDDKVVHATLKQLIPRKTIKLLHVDEKEPSFQRNHSFTKGIEEVCDVWRLAWTINERGLRRAYWREKVDAQKESDEAESPIDLDDFRIAARSRSGSRDLGAQLFTALLRSLALDARLVFSLQVLPFAGVAKGQSPAKSKPTYIHAVEQSYGNTKSVPAKQRKIKDSPYPVFWTEVLNPATASWIPLDPLVRNTINKPKTQFEPPSSDLLNQMTYVLAFEEDTSIRDVTRRYTQWFNAKTRKLRVEGTRNGPEWFNRALRIFLRKFPFPRDEVEDQQLAQRSAAEGMPKNVQDFKGHPVYVLERHLRSNEVLHPRREVGKFSVGSGKSAKVESVYRAQDVYSCRTADAWYRRGKEVKVGEQPLKRAAPKQRDVRDRSFDDDDNGEPEGVALYADFQTVVYEPPPVEDGRIPRNAYGNLDIYVPTMIPAGAVHVSHPAAVQAARVLGIDYADAVTGFSFKGRQGTAIINGAVVAREYTAAMIATIEGLEWLGTQEVQDARAKIILGVWKRMLTALRVRQKIEDDYGEHNDREINDTRGYDDDDSDMDGNDPTYADDQVEDDGGGFMLDADETAEKMEEQTMDLQAMKNSIHVVLPDEVVQQPIKITRSPHELPVFIDLKSKQNGQENVAVNIDQAEDLFDDDASEIGGGGFIPDDVETYDHDKFTGNDVAADDGGGGFVAEDDSEGNAATQTGLATDPNAKRETSIPLNSRADHPISTGGQYTVHHTATQLPTHLARVQQLSENIPNTDGANDQLPKLDHPVQPFNVDANETTIHDDREAKQEKTGGNITPDYHSEASLLSHDPDEDDDEPEWLDDALVSE